MRIVRITNLELSMTLFPRTVANLTVCLLLIVPPAMAAEYPIGVPEQRYGMEIAAVYLQPIEACGAVGCPYGG